MRTFLMAAVSSLTFLVPQAPAHAVTNSVINVTDSPYCTVVNGSTDNTTCIRAAVSAVQAAGGGTLYFPCGNYKTTDTVTVTLGGVNFKGEGLCTKWSGYGSFNTLTFGPGGSSIFLNTISGFYFTEANKTGGVTVYGHQVAQFQMSDILIDDPSCGPYFDNFNDIKLSHVRVQRVKQNGCNGLYLTADTNSRSDVAELYDYVVQGGSVNANGVVINGFVNTISAHKLYLVNITNYGLYVSNDIGASHDPQFITIYGLEADFPIQSGIWLNKGSTFHFTDTQIGGSAQNSNIYISPGVSRVSFQGGFSTGAKQAGMDIYGSQVSVTGMDILDNSNPNIGGTAGVWSGIVVEPQARNITITGVKAGTPSAPAQQRYGIEVKNGADRYAITGNATGFNSLGGIFGTGGTSTRVIANNSQ